ncbi:MAG: response regulator transcription factor [Candidatus Limnocylindria bacterium]
MAAPFRVLLVEDDPAIVEIVQLGLSYEGAEVIVAGDGVEAVRLYREMAPDVVLLDIMLPELDGLDVLRSIRARGDAPVILLTAKGAPEDRVRGLDAGADDYVAKPFHFPELVSRIRALLRRRGGASEEVVQVGDLRIDPAAHEVARDGEPIELTARQFELLEFLARRAGRVVSKEQIYHAVWGWDYLGNPNVVEQHISNLRQRIDEGRHGKLIHTVRGVGYVLREEA